MIMTRRGLVVLSAILALQISFTVHANVDNRELRNRLGNVPYATPTHYFPGCGGRAACIDLPIDPELSSADVGSFNLTESQLRAFCRDGRDQTICQMQHTDCIPESLRPLVEPLKAALTKQWLICDDPNLYTDFLAIKTCVLLIGKKFSDAYASRGATPIMQLPMCPYVAVVAGKSAYDELRRVGFYRAFGGPRDQEARSQLPAKSLVMPAEMLHGFCCGGKALLGCGITTMIRDTCSPDAVTLIKKQVDNTLNAFNCSAITAIRPCKLVFKN